MTSKEDYQSSISQHRLSLLSQGCISSMQRLYVCHGVLSRNAGSNDGYNFPYKNINEAIDRLLTTFLEKKRSTESNMILSLFVGNFMDPFKGMYLSRISEYGLFGKDLNKKSLEYNLECVKSNIYSIKNSLELLSKHRDWYFSDQILENLYRIILNLLSYMNSKMVKDHIMYYRNRLVIDEDLRSKITDTIIEGLKIFSELALNRADKYLYQNDHLHIFFSLYIIILYENKLRPNKTLDQLYEKTHELFKEILYKYMNLEGSDSNDSFYKYVEILQKNNFDEAAKDFDIPKFEYRSRSPMISSESQFAEPKIDGHWIIKRPGFQLNTFYYNAMKVR